MDLSRRDTLRVFGATAAGALLGASGAGASPEPMHRAIPSTGERIPVIGLGTSSTFDVGSSAAERTPLEEVLARFVERGGRVVDSSPMYGRSEEAVGAVAAKEGLKDRLFLATKVWTRGKEAGLRQIETSERLLGTKRLDLLQVHNLLDLPTHLATLRALKDAGRVRYIGVTHYTASAYPEVERILLREKLDFLQVNYSLAEREADRRILPLAREKGVAVLVNRPFAGGEALKRVLPRALPAWAAAFDCTSWPQFFLKWILANPAVTCAIPATSKRAHLDDDLDAALGRLPDEKLRHRMVDAL
jgi:aryl-alcohol dehydrogenase-like predicted oxidoreductase